MSLNKLIPGSLPSVLSLFGLTLDGREDFTFRLHGDVLPVVIAGSAASIQAVSNPMTLDTPFTAGELNAPAANAILADTGAQADGIYAVTVQVGSQFQGAGLNLDWRIQRRDAANAVTVWSMPGFLNLNGTTSNGLFTFAARLLVNERIRVQAITVSTSTVCQASIWLQRIA